MDFATAYCSTRRDIEERGWALTSRLCSLTDRLLMATGRNHQVFVDLKQECMTTRVALTALHESLREHRREHGC